MGFLFAHVEFHGSWRKPIFRRGRSEIPASGRSLGEEENGVDALIMKSKARLLSRLIVCRLLVNRGSVCIYGNTLTKSDQLRPCLISMKGFGIGLAIRWALNSVFGFGRSGGTNSPVGLAIPKLGGLLIP